MATQTPYGSSSSSTSHLKDKAADTIGSMTDKAADSVRGVADQAGQVAGRVADQAREVGDAFQGVSGNVKDAVDKSLKDQPMATLAVVAVLGFILGAIWKS